MPQGLIALTQGSPAWPPKRANEQNPGPSFCYGLRMLHEFLTRNRDEVIRRCRDHEARRHAPATFPAVAEHGVPLFLKQLTDTLAHEHMSLAESFAKTNPPHLPMSIGRAAALHGAEMLRQGCTVDQVVRTYGDVCQNVTEMAIEQKSTISIKEFRILNRCLDDAIADAVTAFSRARQALSEKLGENSEALQSRLESIGEDQRRLIDTALHAFSAVRTGSIGFSGATGTVLMHTLLELRDLAKKVGLAATLAYVVPPEAAPGSQV